MANFKIGDRVERTESTHMGMHAGMQATVENVSIGGAAITLTGFGGTHDAQFFKLVEAQWVPKVGDRVVLNTDKPYHGAGAVRKGDVGVIRSRNGSDGWKVDFDKQKNWNAAKGELSLAGTPEVVIQGADTVLSLTKADPEISLDDAVNICKNGLIEIEAIRDKMRAAEKVMAGHGVKFI